MRNKEVYATILVQGCVSDKLYVQVTESMLSEDVRRRELAPLLSIWKEHRELLASADVMPIGDRPSGRSFTGFSISAKNGENYLLLFREVTDEDTGAFRLPVSYHRAEILACNSEISIENRSLYTLVTFSKPRSYAFIKLSKTQ